MYSLLSKRVFPSLTITACKKSFWKTGKLLNYLSIYDRMPFNNKRRGQVMKKYTLYLDESETRTFDQTTHKYQNPHFCMAGIIVADDDISQLTNSLNRFKRIIWNDIPDSNSVIMHQMRILDAEKGRLDSTRYPEYTRFRQNCTRRNFYVELRQVFAQNDITIVGCCISEDNLKKYYRESNNNPDQYLIAMQFILENYCHFLCKQNGHGNIIYESRELLSNERLRDRYYHIKLMGSMYMTKATTENGLLGLDFIEKSQNVAGLHVADFVPHSFARHFAGMSQPKQNIFNTLRFHRYDGGVGSPDRYGVKYMP